MTSLFAKSTTLEDPATQLRAYKEGRRDERLQTEAGAPDRRLAKAELDDAHNRGRREERSRHRTSAIGAILRLLVLVLAAMAIITIVLAVSYGSFTVAGQAVGTALSSIFRALTPAR